MKPCRVLPLLLALSALNCSAPPKPAPPPPNVLWPQQVDFGRVRVKSLQRRSLNFTVDGVPLIDATFSLPPDNGLSGIFSVLPGSPLGGGAWLLLQANELPGTFKKSLRVESAGREWMVPITVEVVAQPQCAQPTNPCLAAAFDSMRDQCTFVNAHEGQVCAVEEDACAVQHICRSGVCSRQERMTSIPSCMPDEPGDMLASAWEYRSAGTLYFNGTTDDAGAIYFLECRSEGDAVNRDCDVVSLDAEGKERWRAVNVHSSVMSTDILHIEVVGSMVVVAARKAGIGTSRLTIHDRETGAVLRQNAKWWPAGTMLRAYDRIMAVNIGDTVRLWNLETDEELPSRSAPGEPLNSQLVSDGTGWLFGSTEAHFDPATSPPIRIFGWNVNPEGGWPDDPSLTVGAAALATFDGRVLWTSPDIRSAGTGAVVARIPSTMLNFDTVLFPSHEGISVSTRDSTTCEERLLQKYSVETGELAWRCHLTNPISGILSVSRLIGLEGGGAILAVLREDRQPGTLLFAIDSDGQPLLYRPLPIGIGNPPRLLPTMVGSRWIVQGIVPGTRANLIAAYDLPEQIRPATKGWITAGGRLSRDGTPLVE